MKPEGFYGLGVRKHLRLNYSFELSEIKGVNNKTTIRKRFVEKLRAKTIHIPSIISDDVKIEIWIGVHPFLRYETDKTHDVDNLIKPILDAFSGKEGVIIDDTQVVSLGIIVDDIILEDKINLSIDIEFDESMLIDKRELYFVKYYKGLCFPFYIDISKPVERNLFRKLLKYLIDSRVLIEKCMKLGMKYESAFPVSHPIQRDFHITRVQGKGFLIYTLEDLHKKKIIPKSFITELQR
jgi:Holliday junction resolvase RusA-like endonuclease